jgi:hypothetical protein
LVLLVAAVAIWMQATSLPTLTWDAWNAWLAKSKAWYYAGQFLPVRGFDDWLQASPGSAITTTAWVYPEALPRYVSWVVSAAGTWSDAAAQSPWPAAWMALGLSCFGLLGLAGCRTSVAAVATTALLTLPLITAHASLAGYMDLWLAAMLLLAGSHWLRWHRSRFWRDAVFAVLCAGLLPAIKAEGAIWMLCLSAATVLVLLPRWLRWGMVLLGPLLWAVALPFGGLRVPLPGLGWLRLGWGEVEIPTRGVMLAGVASGAGRGGGNLVPDAELVPVLVSRAADRPAALARTAPRAGLGGSGLVPDLSATPSCSFCSSSPTPLPGPKSHQHQSCADAYRADHTGLAHLAVGGSDSTSRYSAVHCRVTASMR